MNGRIFLLEEGGKLRPMEEEGYASEDLLQRLLADYPDLLAGDQMDDVAPRRWLLVRRELGVPDAAGGADRWAVDHLFLDQDGVPTLVEVKRSSDTRLRREVVGQMLDYAAHAAAYWPPEKIRATFQAECEKRGETEEGALAELLRGDVDAEVFWAEVADHLSAGRLRLVFVADKIPRELQRVVEFLNKQMSPTEVLAVEIRQFVGEGRTSLVPRVLGRTTEAIDRKTVASSGKRRPVGWTVEDLWGRLSPSELPIGRAFIDWFQKEGLTLEGGRGLKLISLHVYVDVKGYRAKLCILEDTRRGGGYLYLNFADMGKAFEQPEAREVLCARFNKIYGVSISATKQYPGIGFYKLESPEALKTALGALGWVLGRIREVAMAGNRHQQGLDSQ